MRWPHTLIVCLSAIAAASNAAAEPPAALVEHADAATGLSAMDYVRAGRTIHLQGSQKLVLGYLASCLRETIAGGTVTVGATRSAVSGGTVTRERIPCDSSALRLSAEQSADSSVVVIRKPPSAAGLPIPDITIYSTSPVLVLPRGGGAVTIERLDLEESDVTLRVTDTFLDLASRKRRLTAGGLYAARFGNRSVVFRVDKLAVSGRGPLLGRLIRL